MVNKLMDETSLNSPEQYRVNRFVIPLTLLVVGVVCLVTIDGIVGSFFHTHKPAGEVRHLLAAAEHFGTPYGQILALLCVAAACGWNEPRVIRIFCGAALAGLAANLAKLCIARTRPSQFDFDALRILDSFVGWFPLGRGGSGFQSFPSAHTASAFGFAALLVWAYPRGRPAFLLLAGLVGLQRVAASAHFPSDVLIGGALGWSVGWLLTGQNRVTRFFDRLERRTC